MGLPLDAVTQGEVIDQILADLRAERGGAVLTLHLEALRQHRVDAHLAAVLERTEIVVADGMPLVWASALQGTPLPERIAGSSLVWPLATAASRQGASLFLLGADPGVAERAAERFREQLPEIELIGTASPWVGVDRVEEDLAQVVATLAARPPGIVYVALPFDKQVRVIPHLRERLPATWLLGVGVSLNFVSGDLARAPLWLQKIGLEWAHRLAHEPRLYRRYLVDGLPTAARLALAALRRRTRLGQAHGASEPGSP